MLRTVVLWLAVAAPCFTQTGRVIRGQEPPAPLPAEAGDPRSVSVELAVVGPSTTFHLGEPIVLQLSFFGPPNRYNVNTTVTRTPRPDEVILTPNTFSKLYPEGYVPDYAAMAPVSEKPTNIRMTLNEWFRFEKAGRYTVQIKTPRVTPGDKSSLYSRDSVLITNPVTFEIVLAVPETEALQVARLAAVLDATPDPSERRTALNQLSFLTGDVAAREKVRRFLHPNAAIPFGQIDPSALLISTNRLLVLQLLEEEFRKSDTAVRFDLITTMVSLCSPKDDKAAKEIEAQYLRELFESLPTRSSSARLACAQVLLGGLQGLRRDGLPAGSAEMTHAAYAIIAADFESLDLSNIENIMRAYWEAEAVINTLPVP